MDGQKARDLPQSTRVVEGRSKGLSLVQVCQDTPKVTRRHEHRAQGESKVDGLLVCDTRLWQMLEGAPQARPVWAVAGTLPAEAWTRQTIKEGSQGPMVADFAAIRVVAVRDTLPGPEVWVVLRRHVETGELKTYLCHAPGDTALEQLVRMSGMRWPIATCFEDSKQLLGMGEYEGRSWTGWHHHMTLVILAHFFVVRMSLRLKKKPQQ
jgi:hypothetical protein